MKINRLLTAALITMSTVLTGCVKESVWDRPTGIDESKAAPEEFTYDEEASSKNSITVYWEGDKAVAAGAKSFLVQLTDPTNMDKGDTWNSKVTKVLEVTDDENADYESATFSGLTEYDCYYVRIRANYPGSVYSPWVYITMEDGVTPALMQVGHGEMALVPVISLEALVTDINVSWTKCKDATKYIVEWRKTGEPSWQSAETTEITYSISGLNDLTEYEVKVTNVTAAGNYTCEPVKATTKERPPFPMEIASADEWIAFATGEIIGLANNGADDKVTLTADLDFTGKEYPADVVFKGVVDGNGKTIKNLSSSNPLFKQVTSVQNLTLDATCSFTTTATTFASLAETSNGAITNVKSNATVTANLGAVPSGIPYVIGGLVAYAYDKIENCETAGSLTVTADFVDTGVAGGIVAYTESQVNNSKNNGDVTIDVESIGGTKHPVGSCTFTDGSGRVGVAVCIGGLVGLAQGAFSMDTCENNGTVLYDLADITVTDTYERNEIGGIVGAPNGPVKNCKNTGTVKVNYFYPGRTAFTAKSNIICVGGIGGGDLYATAQGDRVVQGATDYISCVNEGDIIIDNDSASANSAIGGIVGWPGAENKNVVNVTEGCINRGNVTVKGNGKARIGGIQGGSGHIVNCENYGEVKLEGGTACVLGGLAGFHTQNHKLENSTASCKITANVDLSGIGGLIGNNGNAANSTGAGCVVNCVITGGDATKAGMIVGLWNGNSQAVTLGTTDSPIQVSGTVNGEPASASNLCGTKSYKAGTHTLNATIK